MIIAIWTKNLDYQAKKALNNEDIKKLVFHDNFPSHSCYKPVVKDIVINYVIMTSQCLRCTSKFYNKEDRCLDHRDTLLLQ